MLCVCQVWRGNVSADVFPDSPSLLLFPPRPLACISVWSHQTKVSFTSHQIKKACLGTSISLPKTPVSSPHKKSCLSLKFKWIALGHKL